MVRDLNLTLQYLAAEVPQSGCGAGPGRIRPSPHGPAALPSPKSRSRTRVMAYLALTVWIGLMIAPNAAISQEPQARGKLQYPSKPGEPVTLIDSSDPKFTSELETNFPGVLAMDSIDKALPFMVILRNDTVKTVRAYEVRWEDAEPGSDRSEGLDVLKATAITTPLELRWPAGNKSQDKSIRPGEERLVTPWSNIRRDELADFDPSIAQNLQTSVPHQSWKVHIDCAVYGDGSFNGPNQSRLLLTYFISRDALHDEALTILHRLRANPEDPGLAAQLSRRVDVGGSATLNDRRAMAIYKQARAVAAQEFSHILQDGGYSAVLDMASELVSSMAPHEAFTKLAAPYRQVQFTVGENKVRPEE